MSSSRRTQAISNKQASVRIGYWLLATEHNHIQQIRTIRDDAPPLALRLAPHRYAARVPTQATGILTPFHAQPHSTNPDDP